VPAQQRTFSPFETPLHEHLRGNLELPEFRAEHAGRAGRLTVRYSVIGKASHPAVVVLGGVSANADAMIRFDGGPGWWREQVGPGRAIDTRRFRVIGMDFVTGNSIRIADDACRHITTHDQANVLAALLNALHVSRLHAFIGASYGAMVGLAFASRYPERLERLVAISGAHRAHPRAIAIRAVQRRILALAANAGRPSSDSIRTYRR
jgi:homoserine O-acetyltransferase